MPARGTLFRDATGLACQTAATASHPAAAASTPTPARAEARTPGQSTGQNTGQNTGQKTAEHRRTPANCRIKSGSLTAANASAAIPSPSSLLVHAKVQPSYHAPGSIPR